MQLSSIYLWSIFVVHIHINLLWLRLQISGEAPLVKKALFQIASRLHDNPSRSQHLLTSAVPMYTSGGSLMGPSGGPPIVGIAPLMGPYGGYKGDVGDWSRSLYSAPRDDASSKEFSIRLVCPTANIGGVIGKGGVIINQIRQDSGAVIKVDSSTSEGDDCLITVSAKEVKYYSICFVFQAVSMEDFTSSFCYLLFVFNMYYFSSLKTHTRQL